MAMHEHIPDSRADELFFYAQRLVRHDRTGRWEIHVDPENCLTGYDETVDVADPLRELQDRTPDRRDEGDRTVFEGKLPFSAGVVLLVEGDVVMLFRDAGAPVDPCKWTSPAGRCDTTPTATAYQELDEELLLTADGRPAFVEAGNASRSTDTYAETLRRNGISADPSSWVRLDGDRPPRFDAHSVTVRTHFGDRTYEDAFWAFWHAESSTLELRKVVDVSLPDGVSTLRFEDGEYDRGVAVFTPAEFRAVADEDLVATNRAVRDRVFES